MLCAWQVRFQRKCSRRERAAGGRDMVRKQMGLLDEAIRDHLELKRRRGADPGEVAREQREALPAGHGVQSAGPGEGYAPSDEVTPEAVAAAGQSSIRRDEEGSQASQPAPNGDRSHLDQETAEFDMESVLSESPEAPVDDFPPPTRIAASSASGRSSSRQEELDWDFPGSAPASVSDDDTLQPAARDWSHAEGDQQT